MYERLERVDDGTSIYQLVRPVIDAPLVKVSGSGRGRRLWSLRTRDDAGSGEGGEPSEERTAAATELGRHMDECRMKNAECR
ncbi:MAG TPA: hypothetical protein VIL35_08550, partial [Vicinamibacterales bacterium]